MSEVSHVQWFPGHMAKTRRIMASNLKLVDAVVEITDARIPFSSRNPEMKRIVGSKPRQKTKLSKQETAKLIEKLTKEMKEAAKLLEFEHAAFLRDKIAELKGEKK